MKEANSILLRELEKEVAKEQTLMKEMEKVVHLQKVHCVAALMDYLNKTRERINLLRIAIE